MTYEDCKKAVDAINKALEGKEYSAGYYLTADINFLNKEGKDFNIDDLPEDVQKQIREAVKDLDITI